MLQRRHCRHCRHWRRCGSRARILQQYLRALPRVPDGASPIRARDLRHLHSRYKDQWRKVAATTIENGRPDAGMPTWKGILSQKDIDDILSFLATIQPK